MRLHHPQQNLNLSPLSLLSLCVAMVLIVAPFAATRANNMDIFTAREVYLEARQALDDKRMTEYQQLKSKLGDYALVPYLQYQELSQELNRFPYREVDAFLDKHENTYVGDLLLRRWLSQLASQEHWYEYRSYFNERLNSSAHRCLHLWSRIQTGDKTAIEDISVLWNVGESQPDECDPLFKYWQQAGYLTEELVWQRFTKAAIRKNARLTSYLKRLMSKRTQLLAEQFEDVLNQPDLVNTSSFDSAQKNFTQVILFHGLKKYVRNDPDQAWILWQNYDAEYDFTEQQQQSFIFTLAKRYGFNNQADRLKPLLSALDEDQTIRVVEIMLREKLKQQDWQAVLEWITYLPIETRKTERWQYWSARSYQELKKDKTYYEPVFQQLALKRNFYGFLAADYLNQDYRLEHSPTIVEPALRQQLQNTPAIIRARELFAIGKLHDARQEWRYATQLSEPALSAAAHQAAAQMAYEWGWHRKSIESMAAAEAWDDLTIRFPVAHKTIIEQQAKASNSPQTLLFAIARQESAWETDATSSAGAMGLMQLMPRTAQETARKAGIRHQRDDLFQPEHNITLGSRYISELLERYDNNRVPAIAAYNAGPHRVNSWLQQSDNQLAYDVWIEVIPFGETRRYVQNVLSYALVYSHQIGIEAPLLTQIEIQRNL